MKEVFVLYCGDAWLSRSSLVCMGIFSCFDKAVDAALEEIRKTNGEIYEDCHNDLKRIGTLILLNWTNLKRYNKETYGTDR